MGARDREGVKEAARNAGRTSEVLLDMLVEMSDDAVVLLDGAGNVTSWHQHAERLFGYPPGEVVGASLDRLFAEHFRPGVRSVVGAVLAGERIRHYETEVQRPDGLPVPVSLSLAPVAGGGSEAAGALMIARDVTEQRLAQAALADVEGRLAESEALAHVGSWMWDLRTGAVQWSAELHRIHGIDPLDFDGTLDSHLALVHRDDRERVRAAMEGAASSGHPFEMEYRTVQPGGQLRTVRVRAQPTIGSAGAPVGLWGIGQEAHTGGTGPGVSPGPSGVSPGPSGA